MREKYSWNLLLKKMTRNKLYEKLWLFKDYRHRLTMSDCEHLIVLSQSTNTCYLTNYYCDTCRFRIQFVNYDKSNVLCQSIVRKIFVETICIFKWYCKLFSNSKNRCPSGVHSWAPLVSYLYKWFAKFFLPFNFVICRRYKSYNSPI